MSPQDPEAELKAFKQEGFLRIWELELVISGAVIVGLFQIPNVIDNLFSHIELHISNEVHMLPFMFYYIGKLLLYPLLMTFILHFLLRGFWVGLIGLSTIFPNGIIWDRLKLPPLQDQYYRKCRTNLKEIQEKIDQLSSSLFSILFIFLIVFMWIGLLNLLSIPISILLKNTILGNLSLNVIFISSFYILIMALFGPSGLAIIFDKWLEKKPDRIGKYPRLEKVGNMAYHMSHIFSLGFIYVPIIMTFKSNMKKGQAMAGYLFLLFIFPCIFIVSMLLSRGIIVFESYQFFPQTVNSQSVVPVHYDNLRDPDLLFRLPSIQSDMIQDKYIKLFLPFNTKRDNRLVAENCPDLAPYRKDGFVFPRSYQEEDRNEEILACLAGLYRVELNDAPLETLTFSFFTHPTTKVKGLLTYIPASTARSGRNLLKITKKKLKKTLAEEAADPELKKKYSQRGIWFIPFWI